MYSYWALAPKHHGWENKIKCLVTNNDLYFSRISVTIYLWYLWNISSLPPPHQRFRFNGLQLKLTGYQLNQTHSCCIILQDASVSTVTAVTFHQHCWFCETGKFRNASGRNEHHLREMTSLTQMEEFKLLSGNLISEGAHQACVHPGM